jgi:ribonuclease J
MAYEGLVTLVVTVNRDNGELETPPNIIAHGVRGVDAANGVIKSAQTAVADAFSKASPAQLSDESLLKEYLRLELKRFIQTRTGARPVITPVIQQI